VLLVLGTDAAVARAALDDLGLLPQGALARLVVALDPEVPLRVAVHERLELAVLRAARAQVDLSVAAQHLGLEHLPADGADRMGQLEKDRVV
jgi:hypothetical protein